VGATAEDVYGLAHQRQTQAGTARLGARCPIEPLEHALGVSVGDTRTVIRDGESDSTPVPLHLDENATAGVREGIAEQFIDDACGDTRGCRDPAPLLRARLQGDVGIDRDRLDRVDSAAHHLGEIDLDEGPRTSIGAGEREHLIDTASETVDLTDGRGRLRPDHLLGAGVLDGFQAQSQACERRAQVMGRIGSHALSSTDDRGEARCGGVQCDGDRTHLARSVVLPGSEFEILRKRLGDPCDTRQRCGDGA